MDIFDHQLSGDTIAALKVPFEHDANYRNKATTADGERVKPNDSVELRNGSLLRIVFITKDNSGKTWLHGIRLLHNEEIDKKYSEKLGHYLKALLPCDQNEVCAIIKTTTDSDAIDAFLVSEPLIDVVCKRRIIFTNTLRTWGDSQAEPKKSTDSDRHGTLFCRWKHIEKADLEKRKVSEFKLRRLTRSEADIENGIAPFWLLHHHRPGQNRSRPSDVQFTYGDICAGGGGTSRAAELAGLMHRFLLDNDTNACETLRLNFGPEVVIESDVCEFCQLKESGLVVDVVHFSFVCKAHSAANRHTNPERDAEHIALGYTLSDILKMCRPRIVTMEQVPGINKRSDDGQHLRSYIQALTESGYDCRWKKINFQEYGNAQARQRIIIMAACPGQDLPSWPRATNGNGRRLLKPVRIKDALLLVPEVDDLPPHMLQHTAKPDAVHSDPRQPLKACITTRGGDTDVHPYEKRSFNMAELAVLNGFPAWHQFPAELGVTALRELIGNAVPALSFKLFFDKVVEALKQTDEENAQYEQTEGRDFME
ncbi:uncharacterized protein N0V89_010487 [Didymosphaeria variabile]|uniref:DNA (cytosine-5-)-methyltransferase n=1 Tax=Didymosphaeria variabile TaxID=1932322 RepID=A0A9W8XBD2_9PLEO|nr:uncharacterized protein N0V89_010487 [Didymosphaeria variabile]KAJ4346556.1 hypothetical protein N0V89_010487 [Didymosphaeria variabile]